MSIQTIITGQVLKAGTSSFKTDSGEQKNYGKVQLLVPDMSGDFYKIQNIKVKSHNFGLIPDVQSLQGKKVVIECSQETYKNETSNYLEKVVKS